MSHLLFTPRYLQKSVNIVHSGEHRTEFISFNYMWYSMLCYKRNDNCATAILIREALRKIVFPFSLQHSSSNLYHELQGTQRPKIETSCSKKAATITVATAAAAAVEGKASGSPAIHNQEMITSSHKIVDFVQT